MTHFYCSPARHLGESFLSLFTWKQGRRVLPWNVTPSREKRMLCALTTAQLWPQKDLLSPESPGTGSFLEQGDPISSVSHNRKQGIMVVQRSHMLCKVWKVLFQTQWFTLVLASGSAELEVNVFWCSEFRKSSQLWEVPYSYSVNFCTFSFLLLSDLVPESASKVEETWKVQQLWWPSASDRSWFCSCSQVRYHSEYWTLCKATEPAILHQVITPPVIPWDCPREGALEKTKLAIWWQEIPPSIHWSNNTLLHRIKPV